MNSYMTIINDHLANEDELPLDYSFNKKESPLYGELMKHKDTKMSCQEIADQFEQNPPHCKLKGKREFYPDCMYHLYTRMFNMALGYYSKKIGSHGFKLEAAKESASQSYAKLWNRMTSDQMISIISFLTSTMKSTLIDSGKKGSSDNYKRQMLQEGELSSCYKHGDDLAQSQQTDPLADMELDIDYLKTQMSGKQFDLFSDKYIEGLTNTELCKKYSKGKQNMGQTMKRIDIKLREYALGC